MTNSSLRKENLKVYQVYSNHKYLGYPFPRSYYIDTSNEAMIN